ncbi:cell envelope integrity protein TolA [Oleispirillum naphthae]|uniref:cell envelope integrity protein TolA n=1 Tax=Oleispirillum naphthae TaxID=2838853 RepID=UPI0030822286
MRRELGYSLALHLAVILFGIVGLPYLTPEPPELTERILIVDLSKVTVGEKTSLPKATAIDKPKGEEKQPEKKAEEQKPEPKKPEPPPPPPPKPEPPKPAPKEEPSKAALLEEKKAEEAKQAADAKKVADAKKKAEADAKKKAEADAKKKAEADAKKKAEELKKKQKPRPSFDDLMASVDKMRKDTAPPANMPPGKSAGGKTGTSGAIEAPAISKDREGFGDVLTLSEMDMIRAQIEKHWNVDPGKAGALDIVIEIAVSFDPNGAVRNARIVDQARMAHDPVFRSLAESALRAVFMASPVQAPQKKYEVWREVRLFFRPQDRL